MLDYCRKCGVDRNEDTFYKNYWTNTCKVCIRAEQKIKRDANKEKWRERARLNRLKEDKEKECENKFEELKKFITLVENVEWTSALWHIEKLEKQIEEQEKEIKQYRNFFATLQNLMPKQFSIHDTLI